MKVELQRSLAPCYLNPHHPLVSCIVYADTTDTIVSNQIYSIVLKLRPRILRQEFCAANRHRENFFHESKRHIDRMRSSLTYSTTRQRVSPMIFYRCHIIGWRRDHDPHTPHFAYRSLSDHLSRFDKRSVEKPTVTDTDLYPTTLSSSQN